MTYFRVCCLKYCQRKIWKQITTKEKISSCTYVVWNIVKEKSESKSQLISYEMTNTLGCLKYCQRKIWKQITTRICSGKIWLMLFEILSKKNLKANHNTGYIRRGISTLFEILSKKNLKANHNSSATTVSAATVVWNIVKEKSESKSQLIWQTDKAEKCCLKYCQRKIWKQITTIRRETCLICSCLKYCQRKIWKQITTSSVHWVEY